MSALDCLVVGLGPAGVTALRDLHLAGVKVAGIDKAVFPRNKPCGGALSALAQRQLTVSGWESLVDDQLHTVRLALRCGQEVIHSADKPICSFVMREKFDAFLLDSAAAVGADIRTGVELQHIEATPDGVVAITDKGSISARCLLGCDGANSQAVKFVGVRHKYGAALEAKLDVPEELARQWKGHVYLSYGKPARGYGWVFPKGSHLNVGIGSFASHTPRLRQELQQFLTHCGLAEYPLQVAGHRIPVGGLKRPVQKGRVLLAGDAAGFVDPLSGEGIAHALVSGHIAAKHIQAFIAGKTRDFTGYQAETDKEIRNELALARWIANKMYVFPTTFFWFLQHSPATVALYFDLIAGESTYRQVVSHLKRQFLQLGVFRPGQSEDMPC